MCWGEITRRTRTMASEGIWGDSSKRMDVLFTTGSSGSLSTP